jgi:hypothetical protein
MYMISRSERGQQIRRRIKQETTGYGGGERRYILKTVDRETCSICRQVVSKNQKIVSCPGCSNSFHEEHYAEAIKIS